MNAQAARRPLPLYLHRSVLALLFVLGGFWLWFVLASHLGEGAALTAEGLVVPVPLLALALLAWRRPVIGGVALCVLGVAYAFMFSHPAARLMLTLPTCAFGVYFLIAGRTFARRA